ncbi:hypothetical protein [Paenibacillus chitinolyticus]|uniref:hypothetical protein n=1 Tax=Paenibacillus chitinolyticus TaxID=79263 RepID=UPI00295E77EA|nr:hypothetical protein [Paenibacillus chitinolyticus]
MRSTGAECEGEIVPAHRPRHPDVEMIGEVERVNILILIEALERLARKKGVDMRTSIPVGHISIRRGKVQDVETPASFVPAQFFVSNNDYYATQGRGLAPQSGALVCTRPTRNPGGLAREHGSETDIPPGRHC